MVKRRGSRRKVARRSTVVGLVGVAIGALAGSQNSLEPLNDARTLGLVNGAIFFVAARLFFRWREAKR